MIKKSLILFCIVFSAVMLSAIIMAQENKIKVEIKESFSAGEKIAFKVSLYDSQNNLIDGDISIIVEDAEKRTKIEETVSSNKLVDVDLGEGARAGLWTITAKYQDIEVKEFFSIDLSEEVKFEIEGDKLIITNTGNTRYIRTIDIIIGESLGTKKVDLDVGKKVSFRLIAPDGTYNIKVTDGKTTMSKSSVALVGKAIGILDERLTTGGSPVTGGVKPEEEGEEIYSARSKSYVYIFLLVIIGAGVLLAVEKRYRKRV
jgi:hypothetical protein